MQKNTTQSQSSQPADWRNDPPPDYMTVPVERRLYVVGGGVVGSRREEALEVKAIVDEENRFSKWHRL